LSSRRRFLSRSNTRNHQRDWRIFDANVTVICGFRGNNIAHDIVVLRGVRGDDTAHDNDVLRGVRGDAVANNIDILRGVRGNDIPANSRGSNVVTNVCVILRRVRGNDVATDIGILRSDAGGISHPHDGVVLRSDAGGQSRVLDADGGRLCRRDGYHAGSFHRRHRLGNVEHDRCGDSNTIAIVTVRKRRRYDSYPDDT
jgi:hypothetical protein